MASALANIPAETDQLCEECGYVLNGLPPGANCPECGTPADKSAAVLRHPSAWETRGGIGGFFATTTAVLFHPARFYRTLATRRQRRPSFWFSQIHLIAVCLLMGYALHVHAEKFLYFSPYSRLGDIMDNPIVGTLTIAVLALCMLEATTLLAARLTTWEASYRGLRLPTIAVLRGLDFHSVHYLPVAMTAFMTMVGYRLLLDHHVVDARADTGYIYALCAEVIVGAVYLFWTYWIGMRNMMYANA